jgi:hypothetical protein
MQSNTRLRAQRALARSLQHGSGFPAPRRRRRHLRDPQRMTLDDVIVTTGCSWHHGRQGGAAWA